MPGLRARVPAAGERSGARAPARRFAVLTALTVLLQSGLVLAAVAIVVVLLNDWGVGGHTCNHCDHDWGDSE